MKPVMPIKIVDGVCVPIRVGFGGFLKMCDFPGCEEVSEESCRTMDKKRYFCAHHFYELWRAERGEGR